MKELLMKWKVSMLFVLAVSIIVGILGQTYLGNRWLGMIVALPLCALYIYQTYEAEKQNHVKQHSKKHKNKYR